MNIESKDSETINNKDCAEDSYTDVDRPSTKLEAFIKFAWNFLLKFLRILPGL